MYPAYRTLWDTTTHPSSQAIAHCMWSVTPLPCLPNSLPGFPRCVLSRCFLSAARCPPSAVRRPLSAVRCPRFAVRGSRCAVRCVLPRRVLFPACRYPRCFLFAVRRSLSAVRGSLSAVRGSLSAVRGAPFAVCCLAVFCSPPAVTPAVFCPLFAVRRSLSAVRRPLSRRSDLGWVCFEETRGQSGGVGTSASLRPKSALLFRAP